MQPVSSADNTARTFPAIRWICCLILATLALSSASLAGADPAAVYRQAQGQHLAIAITIGSPPPSSLILVQHLPPGVRIVKARPPVNNVNASTGEAKWLLRDISPGTLTIRMTLDRAVNAGEATAEIRYITGNGAGMQSRRVEAP